MSDKNFNILAIPGSLRKNSLNKLAVKAFQDLAPDGVDVDIFTLDEFPFFNEDLEFDNKLPSEVNLMLEATKRADAIVISTPEYNNLMSAATKNVLDWISRSYIKPNIIGKPLGIMGASDGDFGTVRAQNEVLFVGALLGMKVSMTHRVPLPRAQEKFDKEGNLIDPETKQRFLQLIETLKAQVKE